MLTRDEPFQILYEVQSKCNDINQKIDSIIHLLEMLETYMTYSSLMQDLGPLTGGNSNPSHSDPPKKGAPTMNPQEMQKILSSIKKDDKPMSQDEFDNIFETLKQGKSQEEIARMEQMVQMAKNFMK